MTASVWFDSAELLAYLKVGQGSEQAAAVEQCRRAAGRVVERARRDLKLEQLDPAVQADADTLAELEDVQHGARLLAARLYARKGSPQGIATFGELGASAILRTDPDVAQLLGLGRYGKPKAR